jgi:hypothetical protein
MASTLDAVRAEALFVSRLQSSESPAADQVRLAVASALRQWGIRGCAAQVASEFGDHPETAVTRMGWALATIRMVYPVREGPTRTGQGAQPVATASGGAVPQAVMASTAFFNAPG